VAQDVLTDLNKVRNFGIMAHIDAGKTTTTERIVYGALEGVTAKNGQDAVATLKKALDNVRPSIEVKSRRVGGSTYQVPVDVKPHRANNLALRWLTSKAKGRRENKMS
jgi:small subunit ribosomal protein S7